MVLVFDCFLLGVISVSDKEDSADHNCSDITVLTFGFLVKDKSHRTRTGLSLDLVSTPQSLGLVLISVHSGLGNYFFGSYITSADLALLSLTRCGRDLHFYHKLGDLLKGVS